MAGQNSMEPDMGEVTLSDLCEPPGYQLLARRQRIQESSNQANQLIFKLCGPHVREPLVCR
jgi:hypothetical protein